MGTESSAEWAVVQKKAWSAYFLRKRFWRVKRTRRREIADAPLERVSGAQLVRWSSFLVPCGIETARSLQLRMCRRALKRVALARREHRGFQQTLSDMVRQCAEHDGNAALGCGPLVILVAMGRPCSPVGAPLPGEVARTGVVMEGCDRQRDDARSSLASRRPRPSQVGARIARARPSPLGRPPAGSGGCPLPRDASTMVTSSTEQRRMEVFRTDICATSLVRLWRCSRAPG